MVKQLVPGFRATLFFTILVGLLYPSILNGLCELIFPHQANGSLVFRNGHVIGSSLIGQNFAKPEYFHPRPSAAGNDGYDATASNGSNLGPTSQKLYDRVKAAAAQFRKDNPDYGGPIPADALTTSGSGLDPDISIANAQAQSFRVAKARGMTAGRVQTFIASATHGRGLGFLGEPHVNVLELNLALDSQPSKH